MVVQRQFSVARVFSMPDYGLRNAENAEKIKRYDSAPSASALRALRIT
jgi:hypothetical protein